MSVVVYDGGIARHLLTHQMRELVAELGPLDIISDSAAQTIASWWHSPRDADTTALSTSGKVMSTLTIFDFVTQDEYDACDDEDKRYLRELRSYINERKRQFLAKELNRCPECFEWPVLAYVPDETIREENGKQFTECQRCYSDLYRVWSKSRGWQGWEIVEEEI